jgi:hypothetical protein
MSVSWSLSPLGVAPNVFGADRGGAFLTHQPTAAGNKLSPTGPAREPAYRHRPREVIVGTIDHLAIFRSQNERPVDRLSVSPCPEEGVCVCVDLRVSRSAQLPSRAGSVQHCTSSFWANRGSAFSEEYPDRVHQGMGLDRGGARYWKCKPAPSLLEH